MSWGNRWLRIQVAPALLVLCGAALGMAARHLAAQTAPAGIAKAALDLRPSFEQVVRPFFIQNCVRCHNTDASTAGVRVDQLDSNMEDRFIPMWEAVRR